jgi:hypothetical protein
MSLCTSIHTHVSHTPLTLPLHPFTHHTSSAVRTCVHRMRAGTYAPWPPHTHVYTTLTIPTYAHGDAAVRIAKPLVCVRAVWSRPVPTTHAPTRAAVGPANTHLHTCLKRYIGLHTLPPLHTHAQHRVYIGQPLQGRKGTRAHTSTCIHLRTHLKRPEFVYVHLSQVHGNSRTACEWVGARTAHVQLLQS